MGEVEEDVMGKTSMMVPDPSNESVTRSIR